MATLIITEKTSQARDLRAALGDGFGQILPAEGHLLRLAEPHEGLCAAAPAHGSSDHPQHQHGAGAEQSEPQRARRSPF